MEILPKKILSVVDAHTFKLDKSDKYHLSIQISDDLVKICCIEHDTIDCLLLAIYEMPYTKNDPLYIKQLEHIYNEDYFLIKKDGILLPCLFPIISLHSCLICY